MKKLEIINLLPLSPSTKKYYLDYEFSSEQCELLQNLLNLYQDGGLSNKKITEQFVKIVNFNPTYPIDLSDKEDYEAVELLKKYSSVDNALYRTNTVLYKEYLVDLCSKQTQTSVSDEAVDEFASNSLKEILEYVEDFTHKDYFEISVCRAIKITSEDDVEYDCIKGGRYAKRK